MSGEWTHDSGRVATAIESNSLKCDIEGPEVRDAERSRGSRSTEKAGNTALAKVATSSSWLIKELFS
jgi:hypothetical protein